MKNRAIPGRKNLIVEIYNTVNSFPTQFKMAFFSMLDCTPNGFYRIANNPARNLTNAEKKEIKNFFRAEVKTMSDNISKLLK